MKKLFVAALGTFLVLGMAACGPKARSVESFSDEKIANGQEVYGMVGPSQAYIGGEAIPKAWGDADGTFGIAEATSLRDVAKRDVKVAEAFEKKDLKGLYKISEVELGHQALGGYMKGAYNEKGEYVEKDGVYTVKFANYTYDDETEKYAIATWIPSPEAYSESLTPATFWAPLHTEDKDEHGLDHASDSVNIAGAGKYTYYLGVYKKAVNQSFYGIAVFQDEALEEYVAPQATCDYSMPGAWNSWNNAAEMTVVNDTTFSMTITAAENDNGRITQTGTWTTVADVTNVVTGADLVVDDNGGDHNFKFLAAGSYTVTLVMGGATPVVNIVANA